MFEFFRRTAELAQDLFQFFVPPEPIVAWADGKRQTLVVILDSGIGDRTYCLTLVDLSQATKPGLPNLSLVQFGAGSGACAPDMSLLDAAYETLNRATDRLETDGSYGLTLGIFDRSVPGGVRYDLFKGPNTSPP